MSTTERKPAGTELAVAVDVRRALKLWVVLSRAHAAVAELVRRNVAARGLTVSEFAVLEVLYHKGPLHLGDVRRKILVSSGGITYLVDRLEGRGLVERRACPEDRRASYAALTPAGEALIAEIFPAHADALAEAVAGLDPEETVGATDLLRTLGLHAQRLVDGPSE
jgi:MarR family 2-MHQ and catechol resistance regulon transcriptional repressor